MDVRNLNEQEAIAKLAEHGVKVGRHAMRKWRQRGLGPPAHTPPGTNRPLYDLEALLRWVSGLDAKQKPRGRRRKVA
jgi:hypothetical protein